MKAISELLSIKTFRESRAELNVRKQRGVLAEAIDRRDAEERKLEEYRRFALGHERELYDDLRRRVVRLRDIEDVQQEVVVLRNGERSHEALLEQAERTKDLEQKHLDEARETHREATRMKQKFVELVDVYSEEELKELERKEDAELEEVAELRRDRAEWDESHEEAA